MTKAKVEGRPVNVSMRCLRLGFARSGFYKWLECLAVDRDQNSFEMIRTIFTEKRERVGIRQLKMLVFKRFGVQLSRKKIARIKLKYGLVTRIRRKNKYRQYRKRTQEHRTFGNVLNREFKRTKPDEVYSTDITELPYGKNQKAYLAVFKDLATKEIVSSELSPKTDLKLVGVGLKKALSRLSLKKREHLMIHSDQGYHFTHFSYRNLLAKNGVKQSMSRKGNCLDNSPVESFFGYLKDHLDLKTCQDYEELNRRVTKEIDYYNYQRPQWDLKKMPPKKYRRHLSSLNPGLS
ncbi:MAG: IS3 family transposase [Proteobacteria bacterium]|nr:MAG: IS3 family transposase [Pseudomonadota bacterium]